MAEHPLDAWSTTTGTGGLPSLVEKLPVATYTCDAEGLITYYNPAAEQLWGRAPKLRDPSDRFCGSFRLFSADGKRLRHEQSWMALALKTNREYVGHEIVIERSDGQRLSVLAHAIPIRTATGEIAGAVNVLVDITARKDAEEHRRKLEERIRHTQKLESLGVLAGGIAHDFNNLLTPVLGYARLAAREVLPGSPVRSMLDEITKAASHASDLTRQLLAYAGRSKTVIRVLAIDDVVRDMKALLATVVSKKTAFELSLATAMVRADPAQIRQIVMNLITNASEALDGRPGRIAIRTGTRAMSKAALYSPYLGRELQPGRYAYLHVTDTGSGMARETQERIFDPFFSTKFAGRGLGLASVLGIVRAHRGTVQVRSAPDKGTTFEVYLPSAGGAAARNETDSEQSAGAPRGCVVLVVEDDDNVRSFAAAVLDAAGFDVLLASDGRVGLDVFEQHRDEIDVVVLDLTMPQMDGWEVAARLQEEHPGIPVLMMSGYAEPERPPSYDNVRLAGLLEKPFRPDDLVQHVCDVAGLASDTSSE